MGGVGFIADVHIGNPKRLGGESKAGLNRRCRIVLRTLRDACRMAKDIGLDTVFVLGDLFDTAHPSPQMIRAVQKIASEIDLVLLVGNHDMVSDAPGHHALAPLEPVCTVIEKPTLVSRSGIDVFCIPFLPGDAKDWFPSVIREAVEQGVKADVITFHLGIKDHNTSKFLVNAHDCVDVKVVTKAMRALGATSSFAGNWHDFRSWATKSGKSIIQCGTLAPTGWNNPGQGIYGFLHALASDGSITKHEIKGPRFLEIKSKRGLKTATSLQEDGHSVFVKWVTKASTLAAAQAVLDDLSDEGKISGGIASCSKKDVSSAMKDATSKVRSGHTFKEALYAFVDGMQLDRPELAPKIKERVLKYINTKETKI